MRKKEKKLGKKFFFSVNKKSLLKLQALLKIFTVTFAFALKIFFNSIRHWINPIFRMGMEEGLFSFQFCHYILYIKFSVKASKTF